MKFSLWKQFGARNSGPVFDAFKQGVVNSGHTTVENSHDADVDVIWSVLWAGQMKPNKQLFNNGKPTVVLEVGGIIRGTTWKIGYCGIDRLSCITSKGNDSSRAKSLGLKLKPWQTGENILICCQNPNSHAWRDMPGPAEWLNDTIKTIRMHSQKPIIIRTHPRSPVRYVPAPHLNAVFQHPEKIPGTYDDYDLTFENFHAVISPSSNPGPQAIVNGVPAFTGPASLAYDVANTSLVKIVTPDQPERQQWLNDYAHSEYTLLEIAAGTPIEILLKTIDL